MKRLILSILPLLFSFAGNAQTHFADQWVSGGNWPFLIDFKLAPPTVSLFVDTPSFIWCHKGHSNICDSSGKLLMFSDGFNLYDTAGNYIDGGDTLVSTQMYIQLDGWSNLSQSSLILPMGDGIYYLLIPNATDSVFASWYTPYNKVAFDELLLHKVDMKMNGGLGKVYETKKIFEGDSLMKTMMMACRHANGKDWWLLKQMSEESGTYEGSWALRKNKIAKIRISKDSLYAPVFQYFNDPEFSYYDQSGQAMFTQDGKKYAATCRGTKSIFLADFDRCTGELSNGMAINVPWKSMHSPNDSTLMDGCTEGLCFSPDGRFIYVSKCYNVLQYDLQDPDSNTAWHHVAGLDTTWQAFQRYSTVYPGPDGKVYVGNWHGVSKQMSVINNPNVKGAGCDFCPRCLRFPYFGASSPPNMPNYDLGPAGQPCWPLSQSEIEESAAAAELLVYPNPTHSRLYIQTESKGERMLFNALGQLVQRTNGNELDVSALSAGVYWLRVGNRVKKVVVE